jgi:hypothetical protein
MRVRTFCFPLLILLVWDACAQKIPIPVLAKQSAELTTLTAPGATPFRLKATAAVKDHSRRTEFEEEWISPSKWRRTIRSSSFSQTIIVNGEKHFEKTDGDYFPVGLQILSQALFQPIPDELLEALGHSKVKINFYGGAVHGANMCDSDTERTGTPPSLSSFMVEVCFSGTPPSISKIHYPFYDITLKDRQPFAKLSVARQIIAGENESLEWDADVTELTAIAEVDESLFEVTEDTPENHRFKVLEISGADFQKQFGDMPRELSLPVADGKQRSGVVTAFLSIDQGGHVAEVWASSDQGTAISEAARQEIQKWKFGDRKQSERMVQLETFLVLPFKTQPATKESDAPIPPK